MILYEFDLRRKIAQTIAKNREDIIANLSNAFSPIPVMVYPNLQELLRSVNISVKRQNGSLCLIDRWVKDSDSLPDPLAESVAELVGELVANVLTETIGNGWRFDFCSNGEYVIYARSENSSS